MAEAAVIGASNSNYQGNPGLGGGSFGFVKLDTRPIEDLAKYTMLYNKAEYDQRQKDAETAANEIADYTSYDLTSGIPKDAKILEQKYDALVNYMRDNPGALDYRNKEQYSKYKQMRNELDNDLKGAKVRDLMNKARQEKISKETVAGTRDLMIKELQAEIDATDIRTPLKHDQQYDNSMPDMPKIGAVKFDVTVQEPNSNIRRDYDLADVGGLRRMAPAYALELAGMDVDPSTPEGQRKAISKSNNFWQKGTETFNNVIASAIDQNGNVDLSKLDSVSKKVYLLADGVNKYLANKKAEIKSGVYKDKLGNAIQFDGNFLKEEDYDEINIKDGITDEELVFISGLANWKGDGYKTTVQETDDALQAQAEKNNAANDRAQIGLGYARIAEDKRQFDAGQTPDDDGNSQTTGNAFDEIGGTTEIKFGGTFGKNKGKISDGYVYGNDGKLFTGDLSIAADQLPSNMISALKAAGTGTSYVDKDGKTVSEPISMTGKVEITSKDGVIVSVKAKGGSIISRQAMENAQKKFDTEQKGQQRTRWGRTNAKPVSATETDAEYYKRTGKFRTK